ncbi:MAG: myxococcus cysteine-rich repeat containing protein [Myxococcota bacterium]
MTKRPYSSNLCAFALVFSALVGCGDDDSSEPASAATCGNAEREGQESCDDGNPNSGDGCSASCAVEPGFMCIGDTPSVCSTVCGDGLVRADEACDDGNRLANDGCSASCEVEAGFSCDSAEPSVCAAGCGDGLIAGDERCDDQNTTPGDGCDATCAIEVGFSCDDGEPSICTPEGAVTISSLTFDPPAISPADVASSTVDVTATVTVAENGSANVDAVMLDTGTLGIDVILAEAEENVWSATFTVPSGAAEEDYVFSVTAEDTSLGFSDAEEATFVVGTTIVVTGVEFSNAASDGLFFPGESSGVVLTVQEFGAADVTSIRLDTGGLLESLEDFEDFGDGVWFVPVQTAEDAALGVYPFVATIVDSVNEISLNEPIEFTVSAPTADISISNATLTGFPDSYDISANGGEGQDATFTVQFDYAYSGPDAVPGSSVGDGILFVLAIVDQPTLPGSVVEVFATFEVPVEETAVLVEDIDMPFQAIDGQSGTYSIERTFPVNRDFLGELTEGEKYFHVAAFFERRPFNEIDYSDNTLLLNEAPIVFSDGPVCNPPGGTVDLASTMSPDSEIREPPLSGSLARIGLGDGSVGDADGLYLVTDPTLQVGDRDFDIFPNEVDFSVGSLEHAPATGCGSETVAITALDLTQLLQPDSATTDISGEALFLWFFDARTSLRFGALDASDTVTFVDGQLTAINLSVSFDFLVDLGDTVATFSNGTLAIDGDQITLDLDDAVAIPGAPVNPNVIFDLDGVVDAVAE